MKNTKHLRDIIGNSCAHLSVHYIMIRPKGRVIYRFCCYYYYYTLILPTVKLKVRQKSNLV